MSFDCHGWVQQVDEKVLLKALEPGDHDVARHSCRAIRDRRHPAVLGVADADRCGADRAKSRARSLWGQTRTTHDDATYGVRQFADIALKALSPGINDPTTAQDAMFHLGAVLREMLSRRAPQLRMSGPEGRELYRQVCTHTEAVGLAFDEVRLAAAGMPTMHIYLLEILHLLTVSLGTTGRDEALAALRSQADLVLEVSELADLPAGDHERVRSAHRARFGSPRSS